MLHGGVPNYAEEPSYKRSLAEDDDLEMLGMMDMDRDLENLDLEADSPTQPVGDGNVVNWVTLPGSIDSKKQKVGSKRTD